MIAYTSCYHAAAASSGMDTHSISGLLSKIAVPVAVLLQRPNQHLRLWVGLQTITYVLLLHIAVSTIRQVRVGVPSALTKPFANFPKASSCSSFVSTLLNGELDYSMYPSKLRLTAAVLLQ